MDKEPQFVYPMKLIPAGKDYLWGGHRLVREFGKSFDMDPVAESWECSTHPDGPSCVETMDGAAPLHTLLLAHPDYLGTHPARSMPDAAARGEIPILVKFIDAQRDLSVQVHPDDAFARKYENGQLGKSEMWYVLDAAREAQIVYGFSRQMTREKLRRAIAADRLESCLQKVPVRRDDVFFVKAGTVHAIGAGTLIVEVQESSNLTYRLYDYHRRGPDGKERELHIEKALRAADLTVSSAPRQPMRVLRYRRGYASELLCRCRYFEVRRLLVNTQTPCIAAEVVYATDESSFHVLICTEGSGELHCASGPGNRPNHVIPVCRGDTFFLPASCTPFRICGSMTMLDVNC